MNLIFLREEFNDLWILISFFAFRKNNTKNLKVFFFLKNLFLLKKKKKKKDVDFKI